MVNAWFFFHAAVFSVRTSGSNYGKLQAWLYPVLGVLDRFIYLQFDELRIVPDFGSAEPTVEDRVSLRISARALFIVVAAVRVLAEFWREKVLDVFL